MQQMASAFKYVLPDSPGLRTRLIGCFVLVALERCANLAVPLLYKHMVDTLSQVGTIIPDAAICSACHQGVFVRWFLSPDVDVKGTSV